MGGLMGVDADSASWINTDADKQRRVYGTGRTGWVGSVAPNDKPLT